MRYARILTEIDGQEVLLTVYPDEGVHSISCLGASDGEHAGVQLDRNVWPVVVRALEDLEKAEQYIYEESRAQLE